MEAIIYLFQRNIINSIKELKKKPLKIILYIVIGILMSVNLIISIKSDNRMSNTNLGLYRSIFLVFILVFLFISLKAGIEKGNTLFRLSDANFLFPAPIKPQLILFYGFIKQMGRNFFLMILLGFQMPNLYMNFPMKNYGWAIVFLGTFLFSIIASIMGVLLYSIGSIKEGYKGIINYILYGLTGLTLMGLIYNIVNIGGTLQGAVDFFNMTFFNYIPIIGWLLNIYTSAILGFNFITVIYIGLIILSGIGILFIIYKLDLDYYEEGLNNSVTKEEELAKSKSGNAAWRKSKSKTRQTKGKINYTGGKAILSKQILEGRKIGLIFIDKSTLSVATFSLIFAYLVRDGGVNILLSMMVYMNIILSQSNLWSLELEKHYIYLIPENPMKKIGYATLLENVKGLVTGLITFIIATLIYDISLIEAIVLAIVYGSFTSVILFSDLVIRRIIGVGLSLVAERFVRILIIAIVTVPGLILSLILGSFINGYTLGQGSYLILILYNILMSLIFIALSKGIFEKIDMR